MRGLMKSSPPFQVLEQRIRGSRRGTKEPFGGCAQHQLQHVMTASEMQKRSIQQSLQTDYGPLHTPGVGSGGVKADTDSS